MANYVTIGDVERQAKYAFGQAFSFYNHVTNIVLQRMSSNQFLFAFDGIIIDDDFDGKEKVSVSFNTTETYDLYRTKVGYYDELYVGNYRIDEEVEVTGFITIPENTFGGSIIATDKMSFEIARSISVSTIEEFMDDAEQETDAFAKSLRVLPDQTATSSVFGSDYAQVPRNIRVACAQFVLAELVEKKFITATNQEGNSEMLSSYLRNSARKKIERTLEFYRQGIDTSGNVSYKDVNVGDDYSLTQVVTSYPDFRSGSTIIHREEDT